MACRQKMIASAGANALALIIIQNSFYLRLGELSQRVDLTELF